MSKPRKRRARMGRPPKKASARRSVRIAVNVTKAEARTIAVEAKAAGLTLSAFMFDCWRKRKGK